MWIFEIVKILINKIEKRKKNRKASDVDAFVIIFYDEHSTNERTEYPSGVHNCHEYSAHTTCMSNLSIFLQKDIDSECDETYDAHSSNKKHRNDIWRSRSDQAIENSDLSHYQEE